MLSEKNMARALRRHHARRLKAVRRTYWGHGRPGCSGFDWTPRQLGLVVNTPQICSCWVCGNPRRWFGERSMQERRLFQVDVASQLSESDG